MYVLNGHYSGLSAYDNSPEVSDIFITDSIRKGQLTISTLDKANKIIAGTFYFEAYNSLQKKS